MRLFEDAIAPFVPGEFSVKLATERWERVGYRRLRQIVFCVEQGMFGQSDIDAADAIATPIVASTCILGSADQVMGGVRIHEREPGEWSGSRLAVHRDFRRVAGIGAELIRMAVSTAHARGCRRFLAEVQEQNVGIFERLHWRSLAAIERHGRPHHVMQADLAHYAPAIPAELRMVRPLRRTPYPALRRVA